MEYFTGTGLKGRLVAGFFKGVGQIPIDRSGGKASWAALEAGLSILRQGELFGIYPEGTRSPDGRLHRGKTGMARLAPVSYTHLDVYKRQMVTAAAREGDPTAVELLAEVGHWLGVGLANLAAALDVGLFCLLYTSRCV